MTFITADGEVVGGRGGNALLYLPIERAVRDAAFASAELPQVAETAVRMRRELDRLDPNQDAPRIWGQVVNSRSDPPNPSSVRRF